MKYPVADWRHWLLAIGAGSLLGWLASHAFRRPPAAAPVAVVQQLAAERIEKAETKAKETRRSARARVDKEVSDAARAGDLVDYLSRAR